MKKLILSAAMLAMVLMTAAPAIAQVKQGSEQRVESGDASQTFTVAGSGVSANQCAAILVAAQSGNGANSTGVLQSNGSDNEVGVNGSGNLAVSPELAEECEQKINQAATASASKAAPPSPSAPQAKAEEKKAEEKKAEEKKAEEKKAEEKKAEEKKELPKTGGESASLFALGAGSLLVAVGLLARRMVK